MSYMEINEEKILIIDYNMRSYIYYRKGSPIVYADQKEELIECDEIIVKYRGDLFAFDIDKETNIKLTFYKPLLKVKFGHQTEGLDPRKIMVDLGDIDF